MTPMSTHRRCKRMPLPLAITFAIVAASTAHAEDPEAASKSNQLGTIVVTAEKRSEDVKTVPMSISVIDESQLDSQHTTQLADLVGYVPGLTLINTGGAPGQASLALRGIAPPAGTGAAVATYIDETPFGTSGLYGRGSSEMLDLLPYDFQSMEVLRGPQGTLYGANAFGGVVRYVSKQTDLDATSFRVGADTFAQSNGDGLGVGGHASASLPLITDRLALSVSVAQQNSPGFTDNVRSGEKGQDAFSQRAAHAILLWKASDDVSVKFSVFDSRSNADSSQYTALDPTTLTPVYGNLKNDNYVPESYKASDRYFNGTLNWDVGFADFVSSTSYAQTDHRTIVDASDVYGVIFPLLGLPGPGISAVDYRIKLHKTTQEFRLVSKPDDHLEWLLGAFWTRESARQDQVASAQFLDFSPIPGLNPLEVVAMPSTYKEYAGFGDLTYKFTSAFDISAGVRWAHNTQTFTPTVGGALGGVNYEAEDSSESVFTYSVSPRLHLSADSMLYLRVASGYAPGGPNIVPALPGVDIPTYVNSSKLTNYEFGIKSMLDDHRLSLDAALYDIEWQKMQITEQVGSLGFLANAGSARSRGIEFSALYMPIPGLRLGFNGAYTDAVLTEDAASLHGLNGDRLPNVPKWTSSAIADYSFPLSGGWNARVGGGLRYVGATQNGFVHNPTTLPQQGYTALDLNADVSNDRWTLRFFAKNVTDKHVYTNLNLLANAATGEALKVNAVPLAPRTVGVGFDLKF